MVSSDSEIDNLQSLDSPGHVVHQTHYCSNILSLLLCLIKTPRELAFALEANELIKTDSVMLTHLTRSFPKVKIKS